MWRHKTQSAPELVRCSFCGKSQNEVKKILAGPGAFICDECIGLAVDTLEDEDIPLGSGDPDRHVYVQIPVPVQRTAVPTDARIGELLYLVGVDADGGTDTVPVRLLRREPAQDAAMVLLQLRCIKESAVTIAALISGSRPFTILRVLGQPESEGLFARVTPAPPLPEPDETPRFKKTWAQEPWPDPFPTSSSLASTAPKAAEAKAVEPEHAEAKAAEPTPYQPARAASEAPAPGQASSTVSPNGGAPNDTPPHGAPRVEVPKRSPA